jgi:hypothetical protein
MDEFDRSRADRCQPWGFEDEYDGQQQEVRVMWHGIVTVCFRRTEGSAVISETYGFHNDDYLELSQAINDVVADAPICGWVENVMTSIWKG